MSLYLGIYNLGRCSCWFLFIDGECEAIFRLWDEEWVWSSVRKMLSAVQTPQQTISYLRGWSSQAYSRFTMDVSVFTVTKHWLNTAHAGNWQHNTWMCGGVHGGVQRRSLPGWRKEERKMKGSGIHLRFCAARHQYRDLKGMLSCQLNRG